jgi:hypothetical protein
MPSWPTQSDYKDALQNPDTAFRDPDLCASQAERSPMGVPRARSGAFASVYKMTGPKGTVALKLFNFPNDDRAQRYAAVSDYLEKTLGPKKPPCVVKFQYHAEGIRVGKAWYPTLTMAWVKGVSLGEWVRQTVEKKNPDLAAVRAMADKWAALVGQLQDNKIAHGDLQHDNVMVVNDAPVLVDYDGMCVPVLAPADPKKQLEQLEFGKPAYQHPARAVEKLGLHLDNFAAWVILVALRAIAADHKLYVEYVLKTENENLLFVPKDMTEPADSKLWAALAKSADADVSAWAKALRAALDKPYAHIPPFSLDPFDRLRKLVSAPAKDWPAIEAESDRLRKSGKQLPPDLTAKADPVGALKELCAAPVKDWPAIAATGARFAAQQLPADVKALVAQAHDRVGARDALQKALDAGDPRAAVSAYQPALVDDWAGPQLVTAAKAAAGQVALLDKLKAAVASPGDGRALVKLWNESAARLTGVSEGSAYQKAADQWHARVSAAEEFLKALAKNPPTERELATAWAAVVRAGPPHPILSADHKRRGEDAARWAPLLDTIKGISTTASYDADSKLVNAWAGGAALAGCREAEPFERRSREAAERLALMADLDRAIRAADAGAPEDAIIEAAAKLPKGYAHPHASRVNEGAEGQKLLAAIQEQIAAPRASDRKIAAAYEKLRAKNPKLAARLKTVSPTMYGAVAKAAERRKLLDQFRRIDTDEPRADRQDEQWLGLWKQKGEALLNGRADLEELRARLLLADKRRKSWQQIASALAARDLFELKKRHAALAPGLGDYPPLVEKASEIAGLLEKAAGVIAVHEKLEARVPLAPADLKFLRENHGAFGTDAKREIEKQVLARLSGDAQLVPAYPAYTTAGTRGGLVKACWAWSGHGLISYCVVVADGRKFLGKPTEATDELSRLKCLPENHQREGGGMTIVPPHGAALAYVTIWPVVELGWTTLYGPPLAVGPVPLSSGRR